MARTLTSLDNDIIYHLLKFSPDFRSLKAMILTAKDVYMVYKAHSGLVLTAVAQNVFGAEVWPAAWKLLRCPCGPGFPLDLIPNESDAFRASPITSEEVGLLETYIWYARELEDLFSSRHKNVQYSTSRLTSSESARFRRALYRMWLFSGLWGAGQDDLVPYRTEGRRAADREAQTAFVGELSTPELLEMDRVLEFLARTLALYDIVSTAWEFGEMEARRFAEVLTPEEIYDLQFAESGTVFDSYELDRVGDDSAAISIQNELDRRGYVRPAGGLCYKGVVLDSVESPYGKCGRCDYPMETMLWNETNWDALGSLIIREHVSRFRKGWFRFNLDPDFPAGDLPWVEIMNDMFDHRIGQFARWTKQEEVCIDCVRNFMATHLHFWLLERKKRAGRKIPKDCRLGYDCTQQLNKPSHARNFNHLCEPKGTA